jgi:ABC-type lipoprotein release transport system permease subunit
MGALLGVILGLLVAVVVSFLNFGGFALSNFPLLNSVVNMFFSLLIGAFISVLASIIPAYMAAKKEPVEALRVEE